MAISMRRLSYVMVCALAGFGGCAGSHLRREAVGQRMALVQARGQAEVTAGAGATIELTRGRYELALRFDVPRAQIVDYVIACGEQEQRGQVGQTFDEYRTRRLAELNRQQDRDRAAAASAARVVAGAVAPPATMQGQAVVTGPQGTATVQTTMTTSSVRDAAGGVVGDAFPPITELAQWDVGAGRLQARATLMVPTDSTCVVRALADDANVTAGYDVTRVRDLDAEARERQVVATAEARQVRVQLTAQLAAAGADPLGLQKRRDAEARARAEAEAERQRLRAEADAERQRRRAELEAERQRNYAEDEARRAEEDARRAQLRATADAERLRLQVEIDARRQREANAEWQRKHALEIALEARIKVAYEVRGSLVAYLAGTCNADPHKRERERTAELRLREEREMKLRIEAQAKLDLEAKLRLEREARLRVEREQRAAREATLRAEREARDAKLRAEREAREAAERQRIQLALGARVELQAYLVSIGARQRPPMPAILVENPGPPPFDGAQWTTGRWQWNRAEWVWIAGGWTDATVFGTAGSSGTGIAITPVVIDTPAIQVNVPTGGGISVDLGVRDHRTSSQAPATTTSTTSTTSDGAVRDHRTNTRPVVTPPPPPPSSSPTVRDHRRTPPAPAPEPTVRDHRKRR